MSEETEVVVEQTKSKLKLIRCKLNKFETPLFSYDAKGIYVKCKDCRTVDKEGKIRRGTFHLVTWAQLFGYAAAAGDASDKMGVIEAIVHGGPSAVDGGDNKLAEGNDGVSEPGGGGDT